MRILKLKISLLNYVIEEDKSEDQETIVFLKEYGFSENMISQFFLPFFAGFLNDKNFFCHLLSIARKLTLSIYFIFSDSIQVIELVVV